MTAQYAAPANAQDDDLAFNGKENRHAASSLQGAIRILLAGITCRTLLRQPPLYSFNPPVYFLEVEKDSYNRCNW